ncbi:MAG: SDR family oxidoreductase [Isosphaeraceae bacterium]|nr:SDR family oxidoreductase [Isosphaeraceae bacterium]
MRIVLTGASGQLGVYALPILVDRGHEVIAWSSRATSQPGGAMIPVELADPDAVGQALDVSKPDAILHLGAISAADAVRRDPVRGWAVNRGGTSSIAAWASENRARLVFSSTDLVFDGAAPWRREDDEAEPILEYGRTKRAAEDDVRAVETGLVVRVSLLYGPTRCGRDAYFDRIVAGLERGEPQTMFEDEFRTPLDLATAAFALVLLVESDRVGTVHLAGRERMSRFEMVRRVASVLGHSEDLVRANRRSDATLAEPRPADVSLDTSRLAAWLPDLERPDLETAIDRMRSGAKP